MFYGGYGLHGSGRPRASASSSWLPEDERYDLPISNSSCGSGPALEPRPMLHDYVRGEPPLRVADILNSLYAHRAMTIRALTAWPRTARRAAARRRPRGVDRRYLANEAACPNINTCLHLSSRKAMEAALAMQRAVPSQHLRRE
jgi:allantoinase